ncbi:unnamed protein product [Wickerhamomyces anomalus]
MSRQRNIASSGGEGKLELSSSDEELQIDVKEKYNHHSQDSIFTSLNLDESSIIDGAFELFKLLIQTIYSVLPFFIIFYLYSIYQTNEEHFYAPDFPNSLHSSSIDSLNDIGVEFYDLADFKSTGNGWQNNERVLFLVPLRDASAHLPMFFSHMKNLTYPHNLIDLAFLISDTSDSTIPDLKSHLKTIQSDSDKSMRFGRIDIYEKNFGQIVGQSFSDRHGFAAQGPRRKLMAIARNWLLTTALRPDHSWVYWRDADVETVPATIIEDLMHHDKDVIVPNIWRPLPDWLGSEQAYDLNSWQESEGGVELAEQLDEDAVIVEGYPEYATWRPHLAYLRDPYGDEEVEIELDGIGGVSILAKANVFRQGAMFPAFSFKKHAETEAFGKLCKTMGFNVIGLPHYVIWHIYEPSTDDLKHMEWLANEELRQREYEKNKVVYDKAWKLAFEDVSDQWREEKFNVFKNTDLSRLKIGSVDWDEVDEYLAEVDEFEDLRQNGDNDEDFLIDMDNTNKKFEEKVLQSLNNGPVKFGQSKNEFKFGNYYKVDGVEKKKQLKFKKFEFSKEQQEFKSKIEELKESTNDEVIHEVYDAENDKVIVAGDQNIENGEADEFIDKLISDKTINKDKQLFNDLENKKMNNDGEEGELEFKSQQPIKKLKKATKTGGAAKTVEEIITKTLYEIDEAGATVSTVYQWGQITETPAAKDDLKVDVPVVKKAQKKVDEIKDDSKAGNDELKVEKSEPKQPLQDNEGEKVVKKAVKQNKVESPEINGEKIGEVEKEQLKDGVKGEKVVKKAKKPSKVESPELKENAGGKVEVEKAPEVVKPEVHEAVV